ncbi:hypothetical protein GCM10009730_07290 [Streptomyces albidochromogenes]
MRAVEDASGRLVPDVRGPTFQVPDWVRPGRGTTAPRPPFRASRRDNGGKDVPSSAERRDFRCRTQL